MKPGDNTYCNGLFRPVLGILPPKRAKSAPKVCKREKVKICEKTLAFRRGFCYYN